jgi:hypothetical protein
MQIYSDDMRIPMLKRIIKMTKHKIRVHIEVYCLIVIGIILASCIIHAGIDLSERIGDRPWPVQEQVLNCP